MSTNDRTSHLRTAEERATQSGQLLTRIADTVPAYISYVDPDLRYVFVNQTYLDAFGRTATEIEGHLVADVLGPSFPNVSDHLRAALAGEERHFETRMGTLQRERILAVSHIPDRAPDGRICGVIVYGNDITDRKRTEAALLQSEKLAAVGQLASSIAHEINNPLEAITNLLYLARLSATNPDSQRYLETADHELRRVSVIANQTLRFHRQSSSPLAVQASDLFGTVLSIYEGRLHNSGVHVEAEYRATTPIVCFDGDVRQVLNNLVGNAIDAMPKGGHLFLRSHNITHPQTGVSGQVLTVADTGSGMSPETQARIFEAFFTTKGISGTGLGLWVSKEVVERHNGQLSVRSSQSPAAHGTVFRLFLPHAK
jgi:PAS domain S-box-containing protein